MVVDFSNHDALFLLLHVLTAATALNSTHLRTIRADIKQQTNQRLTGVLGAK